jgi:hypothetical protein
VSVCFSPGSGWLFFRTLKPKLMASTSVIFTCRAGSLLVWVFTEPVSTSSASSTFEGAACVPDASDLELGVLGLGDRGLRATLRFGGRSAASLNRAT